MKKIAIYARVSTDDKDQNPETQLRVLQEYASHRDFLIYNCFTDKGSGLTDNRPQFKLMMKLAHQRRFDAILVYNFSRFARNTKILVNALEDFRVLGIDFISYQENIDTTTAAGKFYFAVFAAMAEFQSGQQGQYIKAGMERAKAEGKKVSRPTLPEPFIKAIQDLKQQGKSGNEIARHLNISRASVQKYLKPEPEFSTVF